MLVYFFSYVISLNTFCWLGKACFYSEKKSVVWKVKLRHPPLMTFHHFQKMHIVFQSQQLGCKGNAFHLL